MIKVRARWFWRLLIAAPISDEVYYWLLDRLHPGHLPGWRPSHMRAAGLVSVPRDRSLRGKARRQARRGASGDAV